MLLLSAFADDELVYRALEAGAAGYLTKDATQEEIARAIHGVGGGRTQLAPELAAGLANQIRARSHGDTPLLTERERQVLELLCEGLSAPQIAQRLFLGTTTVKSHLGTALREARRVRSCGRRRRGDAPRHRGMNEPRLHGRGAPDGAAAHRRRARADRGRGLRPEAASPPRAGSSSCSRSSRSTRSARSCSPQRDAAPAAHWPASWRTSPSPGALTYSSGGGFSQLRFAFLFPVVAVAFRGRPLVTASVAAACTAVYVLQAAPHPSRSSSGALSFVLVQAAYLAWLGLALALLSLLLARRESAVRLLSAQRQRLVAEALTAEERERRQLAQDLHDGPIQNLLAARHDLDVRGQGGSRTGPSRAPTRPSRPRSRSCAARSPISTRTCSSRPGSPRRSRRTRALAAERARASSSTSTWPMPSPGRTTARVLRCTSELLANVARHARAAHVSVVLRARRRWTACRCATTASASIPVLATASVRAGHIGLASLRERAEALGGALTLESAPGRGNRRHGDDPAELLLTRRRTHRRLVTLS